MEKPRRNARLKPEPGEESTRPGVLIVRIKAAPGKVGLF
jgi:hypothetical protein